MSERPKVPGLEAAIAARRNKKYEVALRILENLLCDNPNDPEVAYHYGWTLDAQGRDKEALQYYRLAVDNGLSGSDLRNCLISLGMLGGPKPEIS